MISLRLTHAVLGLYPRPRIARTESARPYQKFRLEIFPNSFTYRLPLSLSLLLSSLSSNRYFVLFLPLCRAAESTNETRARERARERKGKRETESPGPCN